MTPEQAAELVEIGHKIAIGVGAIAWHAGWIALYLWGLMMIQAWKNYCKN